jgi:hypothetical protein
MSVLEQGVEMVGMATALAMNPHLVNDWKTQPELVAPGVDIEWKDKALVSLATMAVVKRQLRRLGSGKEPLPGANPALSLIMGQLRQLQQTRRYRRWLAAKPESEKAGK